MTTKELLHELKMLQARKSKNESEVGIEVLQTKYKAGYEKLCNEISENQKELRLKYIEFIRIVNEFAAESVYLDLNKDGSWELLLNKCKEIFHGHEDDPMIKNLLVGFMHGLEEINKGE